MNNEKLDELMKLRDAATPGPWKHDIVSRRDGMGFIWPFSSIENNDGEEVTDSITSNDAAYIVAACNAIPELVARIRELEAQKA